MSCEHRGRVVPIPVVLEPVRVPVPLTIVPVQVQDVVVAVGIPEFVPSATYVLSSLEARAILGINRIRHLKCPSVRHQVASFFIEVSADTTLSETVIADTLGVWILDSAAENLNLLHIRLLPPLS